MNQAAQTLMDPEQTPRSVFVDLARNGLPTDQAFSLADLYGLTKIDMAKILGAPERTLRRRKMLSTVETDRLLRFVKLMRLADEVFDDSDAIGTWLRAPNMALGDVDPLSLLDTDDGTDQVKTVIGRLLHGVFS